MPLFDYACEACGHVEEDFLAGSGENPPENIECPVCSAPMTLALGLSHLIGIVWSGRNSPQTSRHAGITFQTNAEKREWQKEHPEIHEFAAGSPDDRRIHDQIRSKAEKLARRQGFRDLDDRNRYFRREMGRGWQPGKAPAG